jgi:hypothetical protein
MPPEMKVLTLYIGTREPGAKHNVVALISQRFDSFTVISGDGYFRGKPEPMWFVRIASDKPLLVVETAEALRSALNQETVGIDFEGRYYACTAADPACGLKQILEHGS